MEEDSQPAMSAAVDLPRSPPSTVSNHHGDSARPTASTKTEHVFEQADKNGRVWLTLKVFSYARSAESVPIFTKEDNVSGSVELNLAKTDHIQAVVMKLVGVIRPYDQDQHIFWEHKELLWKTSMGDPHNPSSAGSAKLKGSYKWTFDFKLPSSLVLPAKLQQLHGAAARPLPQAYQELSQILYSFQAVIERGKLRTDTSLGRYIGYFPRSRAHPPSELRQLAYRERTPLLEAEIDPDGWDCLEAATIQVETSNSQKADVILKLAIAKPLEYGRGSNIPLILEIESGDKEALDLVYNHPGTIVGLVKSEWWNVSPETLPKMSLSGPLPARAHTAVASATWWPYEGDSENGESSGKRKMRGEIQLPPTLTPSFTFMNVAVTYSIHVLPPSAVSFVPRLSPSPNHHKPGSPPNLQPSQSVIIHPVSVFTDPAIGPSVRSYTPSGLDDSKSGDVMEIMSAALRSRVRAQDEYA